MLESYHQIVTLGERPHLREKVGEVTGSYWPMFMRQNEKSNPLWNGLYTIFHDYQFGLVDTRTETVIGAGNSIPLYYDGRIEDLPGEGWEWAILKGFADQQAGTAPNILCALQIVLERGLQGKQLSTDMVQFMRSIARKQGFSHLIAPVRPNRKHLYPLIPIEDYVRWTADHGLPFDPWMRVHARLGARTIKVCPQSYCISGSIAKWEEWTGMRLPQTGRYIIPEALIPVTINREVDCGEYIEPNVWMVHSVV